MAGSKHPKLLPKAKKDIDSIHKAVTAVDKSSKKWIKEIDTAARAIGKGAQDFKTQSVAQQKMFEDYKAKVEEIVKEEAEAKKSGDKSSEKKLKKLEGEADRLREAYNIGGKKMGLITRTIDAVSTIDSSDLMASFLKR